MRNYRNSVPAELRRQLKAGKHPCCPVCAQQVPTYQSVVWLRAYSHRCPHGEPCHGIGKLVLGASQCAECLALNVEAADPTSVVRRIYSPRGVRSPVSA